MLAFVRSWTTADTAAVFSGLGSFGMLMWVVLSQIPKSRRRHDDEIVHRARLEDEILGRDASPGLPRMPSLSERLSVQDQSIREIAALTKQLRPNGGSSLADRIRRIEEKLDDAKAHLDAVEPSGPATPKPPRPTQRRLPKPKPDQ